MQWFIDTLTWLPAIIIALSFHEFAHGKVADLLGDKTPYYQGRLTINPLPHVDPMGFIMLLLFKFGWAKPVQVNPYNFKNIGIKQGMMLVSIAGPGMNLLLALVGMIILKYTTSSVGAEWAQMTVKLVIPLIQINLILAAFNLIPVPPLDGSKILAGLLPNSGADFIYSLEQYGPVLLLILIITGIASKVFIPLANFLYSLLYLLVF